MYLEDVLNTLSNETLEYNSHISIDPVQKLVVYQEPGIQLNSTVGTQVVPRDFNIFKLLNVSTPPDDIDGWSVALKTNSVRYDKLESIFQQVQDIQYHMAVHPLVYNLLVAVYLPVMIMGGLFNLAILSIILSTKKLRVDPRNSFIVALAFSDLFLCIFTSPLTLWYTLEGHWPLGGSTQILCKVVKAGQDFPIFMSSFCIGAIACDRFRFIVQWHRKQMTANQGFFFSFLLVLVCSSFVSPIYVNTKLWHFPVLKNTFFCDMHWEGDSRIHYTIISSSFHFLLTLIVVVILYSLIYCRLQGRPPSQNEATNRHRHRINVLMASITITFFLCWTPIVSYCFVYDFYRTLLPERDSYVMVGYALALLCGLCTSVANPILYSALNKNFREEVKKKFCSQESTTWSFLRSLRHVYAIRRKKKSFRQVSRRYRRDDACDTADEDDAGVGGAVETPKETTEVDEEYRKVVVAELPSRDRTEDMVDDKRAETMSMTETTGTKGNASEEV